MQIKSDIHIYNEHNKNKNIKLKIKQVRMRKKFIILINYLI